jgi:hypothetical protein
MPWGAPDPARLGGRPPASAVCRNGGSGPYVPNRELDDEVQPHAQAEDRGWRPLVQHRLGLRHIHADPGAQAVAAPTTRNTSAVGDVQPRRK